ncbi:19800_t:CDS:2 [Funneliformis geosporum]|uniref:Endopeptidase S2P n=1 Tax=Funneliformis geosporum TaxID=1117311 RepID=A0A9W4WKN8_9GLOM|nr:19800_t:CDS:2 [Funneliformis geosporum]
MVFSDLLLTFLSFWTFIHVIYRILKSSFQSPHRTHHDISRLSNNANGHLPIVNTNPANHASPQAEITLSYFYLSYKTNKLNLFFETLAKSTPKFWRVWFNFGVLVGILAMIFGVCIMIIAGWKLLIGIIGFNIRNNEIHEQTKFVKRNYEESHHVNNNEDHQVFIPVIPGVTLPISHLIYYLIALLICGVLHEAGHAIAAYCEFVPINDSGIFLYIFYPGAFVSLSGQFLDRCSSTKKLRIFCAGIWHNAVIFLLGSLILNYGIIRWSMSLTGYRSVEGTGVSVISVEENTGLAEILYPSTLITKIDDYELNDASLERWSTYLLQNNKVRKNIRGFCASEKDIMPSLECCKINADHPYGSCENREILCFKRYDRKDSHDQELSCLHAKPILVNTEEQRCVKKSDCDNPSPMCVLPYTCLGFPRLVRIYFERSPWTINQDENKEQVLLWIGELDDLWEIIQVSILQPRYSWIPLEIPLVLELILRYTTSFSLALCILNILPVYQLDGYYVLTAILTWLYEVDDRGVTNTVSKIDGQKKKFENAIVYSVTGLVCWVVIGTLIFGVFF